MVLIILFFCIEFALCHMPFYGRDCVLDRNKDLCCSDNQDIVRHWVGFEENHSVARMSMIQGYK